MGTKEVMGKVMGSGFGGYVRVLGGARALARGGGQVRKGRIVVWGRGGGARR